MLVFKGEGKEREIFGIVITEDNIELLKNGKPILARGEKYNIDMDIVIHYSKNLESAADEMKDFIGPETIVHNNIK